MTAVEIVFWVALFTIVFAYIGYPLLLWLASRFGNAGVTTPFGKDARLPAVTLLIAAYNEEQVIGAKIENALALDYPRDLLEIVVVSDGSTDGTCEIVQKFSTKGVVLRHYEGRIGKTECLNGALPLATGEIIVFSDANSTYTTGALTALLQPFSDDSVGFVTGWTRYGSNDGEGSGSLGLYSRLELLTKEFESRLGSCIGADGAIFAIRKSLYVPLKGYDINDFVIPLSINKQGFRGVLQRDALCFEKDAGSSKGEFHRQVRITSRTIRAIMNYRQILNPFRFGLLAFELFSHKVCKFLVPVMLVALFVSNWLLVDRGGIFLVALGAQLIFYTAAGAASFGPKAGLLSRLLEAARTFVVVNAAIALAWVKYFQGETYTTWAPTKR